jgi:hypothetical protein
MGLILIPMVWRLLKMASSIVADGGFIIGRFFSEGLIKRRSA